MLDIREILRHLHRGEGVRGTARSLRLSRKTVAKYRDWAAREGLLTGRLPDPKSLQQRLAASLPAGEPPQIPSQVEPFRARVQELRRQGVECRAILERLREEKGFQGSYSSVWRFVRALEPATPEAVIRIETKPGEEAQVDFGYAGRMIDPRDRREKRTWAFVLTLSWSRHQYVEFVFDQEVRTWLRCHRHAFEWLGGVPRRIVIDNLKAAILRASLHDPVVQRAYRECAEHYGFLIAPCRPRTPRHKGKVEKGGVHYLKRNFLAGQSFRDALQANDRALVWCDETAGRRLHGTTKEKPRDRFDQVERAVLQPLPAAPYALAVWKKVKLHPDCHVVFDGSFYSAPHRLIGKTLWVRSADTSVWLFAEHELVASHPRAVRRGQRFTLKEHLPPAKVAGLLPTPAVCLRRAQEIGPRTAELVGQLLGERPLDRLRTAQAVLRLAQRFSPRRLEAACTRALCFSETSYGALRRILREGLDLEPLPVAAAVPAIAAGHFQFVRPWTDFFPQA